MADGGTLRRAREDVAPEHGRRLIVQCGQQGCDHAVLLDPRPLFGSPRNWPVEGWSSRFRCQCGSRQAKVSYTHHGTATNGPISAQTLALWF